MSNILRFKRFDHTVLCTVLMGFVSLTAANAQDVSTGAATPAAAPPLVSCFQAPAKIPDAEVQGFLQAPAEILSDSPTGGMQLSSKVRALIGSSSGTLEPILDMSRTANGQQLAAIGAGLARAARSCALVNADYAATIQLKVAEIDNNALNIAFAAGLNDVQTAALGAGSASGGAAGAAGIGGGGVVGGGTRGLSGDETTAQTSGTSASIARSSRYFSSNTAGGSTTESGSAN